MQRRIGILKTLVITGFALMVGACVTMPTPSTPTPPSMPSSIPPPSSPSSSAPGSPPPSGTPSQSSGSPSQSSGSPSQSSGSPSSSSGSQGGSPSEPAGGSSLPSPGEGQPSAGGGTPTDLDILEPEPVTNTADASDSMEESADSGGAEGGSGEQAGGEQAGGEQAGGEQAGGEQAGGEQAGGEQAGGGAQGGGAQGGSLDDALIASVEGFEDGMQRQILIIASATPGDGMHDSSQEIRGGSEAQSGGGEITDQTGGGAPGLIIIEGDISQLPQGSGEVGGPTSSSGVINVNDQGGVENRQTRQGDSRIARILIANIPEDIGDGSDDDVVARQIREAAMNEQDPVLREKLWQEYRNYKKSMGRKKF